jgi:hypothetical protein
MRYMDFLYFHSLSVKKNPIRFKMNGILGICFGYTYIPDLKKSIFIRDTLEAIILFSLI